MVEKPHEYYIDYSDYPIAERAMRHFFLNENKLITTEEFQLKFFPGNPNPENGVNELIWRVRHNEAPKRNGSLFTITGHGYVYLDGVQEPGTILRPAGFMPDPDWFSGVPFEHDMSRLLVMMRYATVINQTEAEPRLAPAELKIFLELSRAYGDQSKLRFLELDLRLHDMKPKEIIDTIAEINHKLDFDTTGVWSIVRERHGRHRDDSTYSLVQR
ncbi:MAG TPA: hypothetical protein VMR81_04755 [Patescibacteria group bacterium]|nr:hypothetical protein [Patescibacteria group bacterium]